jgi:SagB-type dehydrogenase family enzyme
MTLHTLSLDKEEAMIREKYPLAWMYHRNTSRYAFNVHGLNDVSSRTAPFKEYLDVPVIALPEVELPTNSLKDALLARVSCRHYSGESIALTQIATLLKAAYGVYNQVFLGEHEFLERSVPSGGGLYPLELYILARNVQNIEPGVYHYAVYQHTLEQVRSLVLPDRFVSDLFLGQPYLIPAAAIIVITAMLERSLWKYEDRGYRYILFEAGHVAQNINLTAVSIGLDSLNLGGFFDVEMANLLDVDIEREIPLYATAVGVPALVSRDELRMDASGAAKTIA